MKDILSLRLHVSLYPLPAFSFVLSNGHTKGKRHRTTCQDDNNHPVTSRTVSKGTHAAQLTHVRSRKDRSTRSGKNWEGIFYRLTHEGGLPIDTLGQELVRLLPSNTQLLFDIFSARFLDQEITQGGNRNHQTENST